MAMPQGGVPGKPPFPTAPAGLSHQKAAALRVAC